MTQKYYMAKALATARSSMDKHIPTVEVKVAKLSVLSWPSCVLDMTFFPCLRFRTWKTLFIIILTTMLVIIGFSMQLLQSNTWIRRIRQTGAEQTYMIQSHFNNHEQSHQEERQEVLGEFCTEWEKRRYSVPTVDYIITPRVNPLIMPDINLAVCLSAKAGSTFWREYLAKRYHGTRRAKKSLLIKAETEYINVLFVRHPLYRLFSAYNDRVVRKAGDYPTLREVGEKVYRKFRGVTNTTNLCFDDVTFEEYIKLAITEVRLGLGLARMESHRWPYFERCRPCQYKFDVIGKLETISSDVSLVLSLLKMKGINITLNQNALDRLFLDDKCRGFKPVTTVRRKRDIYNCSTDERLLQGNLKALRSQGFKEEHGFTNTTFSALPLSLWYTKCLELVSRVNEDPVLKKKVKETAAYSASRALQSLPSPLLHDLIEAYLPDFKMFGYSTENIF